jgi:hypothetical protein
MAIKTETKTAQIPDDMRQNVHDVINALRRAIELNDFEIRISHDMVSIKIPDIKVYIYKNFMRIIYKDFDIVYSNHVAIKVYKDIYSEPDIYKAHEYWAVIDELHRLAKEKVKEKLEKALEQI